MGYMRHHAIVVSSWNESHLESVHKAAIDIFPWVSPISPLAMNRERAFFIPPDGSKEGWEDSDKGDDRRERFLQCLNRERYEDGSTALSWVEICYGGDEKQTVSFRTTPPPAPAGKPREE